MSQARDWIRLDGSSVLRFPLLPRGPRTLRAIVDEDAKNEPFSIQVLTLAIKQDPVMVAKVLHQRNIDVRERPATRRYLDEQLAELKREPSRDAVETRPTPTPHEPGKVDTVTATFTMIKASTGWLISSAPDGSTKPLPLLDGLDDIASLVTTPDQDIFATDLRHKDEAHRIRNSASAIEAATDESVKNARQRVSGIQDRRNLAHDPLVDEKDKPSVKELAELDREEEAIKADLRSRLRPDKSSPKGYAIRKTGGHFTKDANALRKRVNEAIGQIEKAGLPRMADHLRGPISFGASLRYATTPGVTWRIERRP